MKMQQLIQRRSFQLRKMKNLNKPKFRHSRPYTSTEKPKKNVCVCCYGKLTFSFFLMSLKLLCECYLCEHY